MSTSSNAGTQIDIESRPLDTAGERLLSPSEDDESTWTKASHVLSFLTAPQSDTSPGDLPVDDGPLIPIEDYRCFRQGLTDPVTLTITPAVFSGTTIDTEQAIKSVVQVTNFFCNHLSRCYPTSNSDQCPKVNGKVGRQYDFTLNSLPVDVKTALCQGKLLDKFRSIELTMKPRGDRLLDSFKEAHRGNTDVTKQGKLIAVPAHSVSGGFGEYDFQYTSSRTSTELDLTFNVDSPNTCAVAGRDDTATRDELGSLVQDRTFSMTGVTYLIVRGTGVNDAWENRMEADQREREAAADEIYAREATHSSPAETATELGIRYLAEQLEALRPRLYGPGRP
ncbi:uncharacterized protein IL334_006741 [Kwoniella shivajii]|uniref:Uncharacterized protein n=1 Tax=Kwoniella shivajii TaxID=564305 RepID=A0ABZ1D750_9TREE|nr:hypothetical protein IL334_006741 [Kwoniella shivajii]